MKTKSTQIKITKKLVKKCESKYRCSKMRSMRIMCFPVFIASYFFDQNTNSDDNIHTLWMLPIACSLNSAWWNYGIFLFTFQYTLRSSVVIRMPPTAWIHGISNEHFRKAICFSNCRFHSKRTSKFVCVRLKTSSEMNTNMNMKEGCI